MKQEIKNIHLIPTNEPSRLFLNKVNNKLLLEDIANPNLKKVLPSGTYQNIYITSDEEITGFENNIWVYNNGRVWLWQNTMALRSDNKPKKIILTADLELIADGVQDIDSEFLEWFVKNPSCEEVEVNVYKLNFGSILYKIIIPKDEPKQEYQSECICDTECRGFVNVKCKKSKQETLEEAANKQWGNVHRTGVLGFIEGAKWMQERMYSKEEVEQMINSFEKLCYKYQSNKDWFPSKKSEWFEQFKKK